MFNKISNYLSEKYNMIGIFALLFLYNFLSQKLYTSSGSIDNVEQWINVTNQMFYGNQDFLFSYGPLYWIVGGTTSSFSLLSYWVSVAFISFVITLFWFIIFINLYKNKSYFYFAITYFLFIGTLNFSASFFLWPILLIIYIDSSDKKLELLSLQNILIISVVIAFFFYIRFFYGLIAFLSFGSYFFIQFFSKEEFKKIIYAFIVFLFSFIVFGLLIFNDYDNILNYLIMNSQLSLGNSVDMTIDVVNSNFTFKLVGLIFILFNIYLLLRNRQLLITINILLLLFFKLGFSRTDHYFAYFVIPVSILALLITFYNGKLNKIIFLLITACLYYLSVNPVYSGATIYNGLDKLKAPIDFEKKYEERMKNVYIDKYRLNQNMLDLIGNATIDVYPYNNEYLFANKLNYLHRPSFQNYMTLTPKLDEMNKQFFESKERPKFILWTSSIVCSTFDCNPFNDFDNKHIMNEDPLTTTVILQNYHIVSTNMANHEQIPMMLLQENNNTQKSDIEILNTQTMTFNTWYDVPKNINGIIKLVPNFKFTIRGHLKNLLFRGNIVKIKYKTIDNRIYEYRLNIINSKSGIWISPLPVEFPLNAEKIQSVMLSLNSDNYFENSFEINWIKIDVPSITIKEPRFSNVLQNNDFYKISEINNCAGSTDIINQETGISTLTNPSIIDIQGWLAKSTNDGELFDNKLITISDEKGNKHFLYTDNTNRQDLVDVFGKSNLLNAGYKALIDTSKFAGGKYILNVSGIDKSNITICKNLHVTLTINNKDDK
ncbi:MAG TPA: hypothetical protein CFH84_09720 [Sulfurimonas sp. UBA12504]|nr:MAG: hypothetical protein A2019_06345 [Sulfurimonas sp. GWF2_37_8]DAB29393.1 MAG TPA: hypothetical protein CFH84_09720 [Sulfurimonas sp. UBA12504]